jgi:dipeptidyl aminopeptidase/acylaminoacyl peptidase
LASIEAAIKSLVSQGIADPKRVGIMGISYGGFLTEFAITHSKSFKVSSLVDGGGYSPVGYWLSNHEGQEENERALGGPPSGSTYANWLKFSPPLNVANVTGPVLMGFNSNEAVYGFEMLSALRREGIPVEFWVYPGEGHIFTTPEHRFSSMQRNLDWFNFWLFGKEDAGPAKQDQYVRWHEMRKQLASPISRGTGGRLKDQAADSRHK